ncbi:MAG: flagellar basal body L-ring protein FlgH [Xanthomonadaceae bacterium]|nr:flagellar basal body L-ring protein FlgH [Xanthomonadaceae bacterium]
MRILLTTLFLVIFTTSCADMMKKEDVNSPAHTDEFTGGGFWPERGLFDGPNTYDTKIPNKNKNGRGIALAQAAEPDLGEDPDKGWSPSSKYKNGNRASKADFVDVGNEGSLWASEGQTNYFFVKNKVRSPGEIVTIKVDDPLVKEVATELKRTLTGEERQAELDKIQAQYDYEKLVKEIRDGLKKEGDKEKELSNEAEAERRIAEAAKIIPKEFKEKVATDADIDFLKETPIKAGDIMMGEIMDRYPNGNYRVRGTKRVYFRGNPRTLSFVGIVKSTEIDEKDITETGKFYEYRLRVARQ